MLEENKAVVRRFFEESDRRKAFAVELCALGFIAHVPGSPPMDLSAFRKFGEPFYASFSDWRRTFEDMVAESDRVAFRFVVQVTHTTEFMGVPASDKQIMFSSIGIARLAGGKIAEWWNSPDRLGMMQQLGAIPT